MDEYQKFIKSYRTRRFSKGEVVLFQGVVPTMAYVVKSGIVKTYNLTVQGEEKPIAYNLKDEIFPMGWVFSKLPRSQYYYEAMTDCVLYEVPQKEYIRFLQSHPACLFEIFDQFVERYITYHMLVNALEQKKAADKVIATLDFLCKRFGRRMPGDQIKIELPMTQQDMANFMGLTRETTGLELKKLERKGVVTHRFHTYTVMSKMLSDMLGEDYVPQLPKPLPRLKIRWPKSLR